MLCNTSTKIIVAIQKRLSITSCRRYVLSRSTQFIDQWQISEAVQENKEKLEGVPLGILVSACASACDDPNTDTCSPCAPNTEL